MANEEHLALLKQSANEWNQWRKKHRRIIPDLEKANLCHLDLGEVNLKKARLNQANFSQTNLKNAQLAKADLQGANFLGADLRGADLQGANLDYVIFTQAKIDPKTKIAAKSRQVWEIVNQETDSKNFSGIDLSYTNLFGCDLSGADLSNVKFNHANLSRANLKDAYLYKADLTGVNFHDADLTNAYFSNANLTKAYLGGASCCGTYFKNAELKFANLKTAKISHKTMIDLKWYSVWEIVNRGAAKKNLSGIDLSNANLQGVNFEEANLTNANLSNAILRKSNLNRANLTNTDLMGANICGVKLDSSHIKGTKLKAVVSDRDTQLPVPVSAGTTTLIAPETTEAETQIEATIKEQKPAFRQRFTWIFLLGIIGFIAIVGYIFFSNNPDFPWKQKIEQLVPQFN
jgi:uncharacterized protein YjbI with pentapeptide repeats